MNKSLAKFILGAMIISGIIAITLTGMVMKLETGSIMGEDGVLGMALMGLTNYDTNKKKEEQ